MWTVLPKRGCPRGAGGVRVERLVQRRRGLARGARRRLRRSTGRTRRREPAPQTTTRRRLREGRQDDQGNAPPH